MREPDRHPAGVLADEHGLTPASRTPAPLAYLRELVARRDFAYTVALGELRAQSQDTVLGHVWHLLNPMLFAAVYYFAFGVVLGAREEIPNYPVFLVTGIFVFHYTQRSTVAGARTVEGNLRLIRSIRFPRALLPLAALLQESLAQLPVLLAMVGFALLAGVPPAVSWVLLLPLVVIQAVFNLGLALVAARLVFHVRDIEIVMPHAIRIWFYLSGVFFTAEMVAARAGSTAAAVYEANPMYSFVTVARLAIFDGGLSTRHWLSAIAWAVVVALFGIWFFRSYETDYGLG